MGRKHILLIFESSLALKEKKFKEVPEILEKITNSENFEIETYSFTDFIEKEAVKFSKAVIICQDATDLAQKVADITGKFDPEDIGGYTVLLESDAKPETKLPVIHTSSYMADLASWWPQLLWFLFPREQPENPYTCLFLFDSQSGSRDHEWYQKISNVLNTFSLTFFWTGDLPEVEADFQVILCQNGGKQMLECSEQYLEREVKTIIFTDDKNSSGYKVLKKKLRKKYCIQSDTPSELDYLGWSTLMRELKLIKCRDVAFAKKRKNKKIVLYILVAAFIMLLVPLVGFLIFLRYFCDMDILGCFDSCSCTTADNETCQFIIENVTDPCQGRRKVGPKKIRK